MATFSIFSENYLLLLAMTAIIGAAVGSFLNVVIYRLPLMLQKEHQPDSQASEKFSLAYPSSHCPQCQQPLKIIHNIPIVSYLLLHGKCSSCNNKIPLHYPLVEALSLVLSLAVVMHLGFSLAAAAGLILTWTLIALAVIDFQKKILPDEMTLGLLWIGLLLSISDTFTTPMSAIIGAAVGYGFFWILNQTFVLVAKKHGLGYGDMKLLAAFGAWFGWEALATIVILASTSGLIVAIPLLLAGKINRGQQIPFAPYLCFAAWLFMMLPDVAGFNY